jgi:hypothetical protein
MSSQVHEFQVGWTVRSRGSSIPMKVEQVNEHQVYCRWQEDVVQNGRMVTEQRQEWIHHLDLIVVARS